MRCENSRGNFACGGAVASRRSHWEAQTGIRHGRAKAPASSPHCLPHIVFPTLSSSPNWTKCGGQSAEEEVRRLPAVSHAALHPKNYPRTRGVHAAGTAHYHHSHPDPVRAVLWVGFEIGRAHV